MSKACIYHEKVMLQKYKKIPNNSHCSNYLATFAASFYQIFRQLYMDQIRVKDKDFKLFLSEKQIQENIQRIADKINHDLDGKNPLFLAVLNGSFMFAADLMKKITIPSQISFVKLASYEGMQSGGTIREVFGLTEKIEGRTVVIVEDIVDSGRTMQQLLRSLDSRSPAEIRIATFLLKPEALQCELALDYVVFEVPNEFVVGYGMDYDGFGRNLSEVYSLV
jgi:hypoxanthine phosphoribosyltransferase